MTKVTVFQKNKVTTGIQISGHSGFADAGKDIVCSAISILGYTAINAIQELVRQDTQFFTVEEDLTVFCPKNLDSEEEKKAVCILETIVIGLKSIEMQYHSYIRIEYREV